MANNTQADQAFKDWFTTKITEIKPMIERGIEGGIQLPPALMVFNHTGQVAIAPVDLNSRERKLITVRLQASLAEDTDLVAGVILMFESWAVLSQAKPIKDEPRKSLEFHPDRQEAICATCMRGNMQLMATSIIDRATGTLMEPRIVDVNDPSSPAQGAFIVGNTSEGKPN